MQQLAFPGYMLRLLLQPPSFLLLSMSQAAVSVGFVTATPRTSYRQRIASPPHSQGCKLCVVLLLRTTRSSTYDTSNAAVTLAVLEVNVLNGRARPADPFCLACKLLLPLLLLAYIVEKSCSVSLSPSQFLATLPLMSTVCVCLSLSNFLLSQFPISFSRE